MQTLIINGRLTRDPETSVLNNDKHTQVCRFGVAVNRRRSRNQAETADFFNVTAFGSLADLCGKYLKKGQSVCVRGEVRLNQYTAKDGSQKASLEVTADTIDFGSKASDEQETGDADDTAYIAPKANQTQQNGFTAVEDDELPF